MGFKEKSDDSGVLRGASVMGSTGEADKKRRHVSSLSPTAAMAKKRHLAALSEEKKVRLLLFLFPFFLFCLIFLNKNFLLLRLKVELCLQAILCMKSV